MEPSATGPLGQDWNGRTGHGARLQWPHVGWNGKKNRKKVATNCTLPNMLVQNGEQKLRLRGLEPSRNEIPQNFGLEVKHEAMGTHLVTNIV